MSDLFGRFPGWLVLIWGRPCVRRCVVRPADVCCGVAGRRDASGAFASCRSINSRPLFSSFSDHLPASPPALLCPFAGPSPNFSRVFSGLLGSSRPFSSCRPVSVQSPSGPPRVPLQTLSRPFSGPSRTLRNPPPTPQDTKKEVAPSVQPPLPEPNPRLELGTPSLRVKCSTTELIRPARTLA